jgi:hypothetical protein
MLSKTYFQKYPLEDIHSLCKRISCLILKIPASLLDLHRRAELATPLLNFVTEVL